MTDRTDTFIRGNNSTTLGTPSDGGSDWVPLSTSVWGINSNQGYKSLNDGVWEIAYLESSVSDVDIQVTITNITNGSGSGLCGRVMDNNNYLLASYTLGPSGNLRLFKNVSGFVLLGSQFDGAVTSGDVLRLSMNGSSLALYQNGVLRVSATDSAGLTNTKHGLATASAGTVAFFTAFSITGPVVISDVLFAQSIF